MLDATGAAGPCQVQLALTTVEPMLPDGEGETTPLTLRAVIRDGRLTVTRRPPFGAGRSALPYSSALREAGTVICDVTLDFDEHCREISVRFVPEGTGTPDAVEALCEWARLIGCGRVWLPEEIIEMEETLAPDPRELPPVSCPTCGIVHGEASAAEEIASLRRRNRLLPRYCPVCGCPLPERVMVGQERSTT